MAGAFAIGTTQNALGSVVGGVAGNPGGTYLEKHTIAGLHNSAADYRTRGVCLFETYGCKLTAAERERIKLQLEE